MGRKDLERLVGKICSIHLVVLGAVAHLYHIQRALAEAGEDRAWLSLDFHREIADWRMLAEQTADQPTHLAEIVRHEPTHPGFCDASGPGSGGVWLGLSYSGKDLVWRHPWLADIISKLVPSTNREGMVTNSDPELAAIVLYEATLLAAVPDDRLAAPCSGSDNNPAVSWIKKEALTINPVITDLLRLHALHLRQFFLHPSIFYHPGTKNRMADNASRLLNFLTPPFSHTCPLHIPSLEVRG